MEFIELPPFMPFCSQQCQLVDLGRWFNEDIGLPHQVMDDEEAETLAPPTNREIRFD
jgi:endogenous inhibitor of DNA gyrase (YacG/DUF329 family)